MASELYSTSARNRSSLSRSAASAGWRSVRSTIVGAVRFAGFFGERAIGSMLGVPGGFARKSRARLGGRRQPAGSLQTARAQSGCGGGEGRGQALTSLTLSYRLSAFSFKKKKKK